MTSPDVLESQEDELPALIELLHRTGQRLEELTAGQVDAVASRNGTSFLLQRAQEALRSNDAAKQAAILNALPADIALLDAQGLIASVNDAWKRMSGSNVLQGAGYGIGLNYIAVCAAAKGEGSPVALRVARGIRSVLAGAQPSFTIEYPCDCGGTKRWFQLTATPLSGKPPTGAVVMHTDITAERQTRENLRVSNARFRQMADNIRDVFFLRNLDGSQMYYVSPAYEQIWGRTCESLYANAASWSDAVHPDDRELAFLQLREGMESGFDCEYRILRPDGEVRWIQVRAVPILDDAGNPYRTAGIATDITERKLAERKMARLSRVHAMLSRITSLIVRVRDRDELFWESCRIAVEAGGFQRAWIGVVDPRTLEGGVIAWYGCSHVDMRGIKLTAVDGDDASRPASRALRLLCPVICNDIATDPPLQLLFEKQSAQCYRSVGCFPLTLDGRSNAVLTLFAGEADVFDEEETQLLNSLAGDISFALGNLDKSDRLNYAAYYDLLTGLANQQFFLERVSQYLRSAKTDRHTVAVCLLDLERFKSINDNFGKVAGDALLQQVALWLTATFGDAGILARLGADRFALVLAGMANRAAVEQRLQGVVAAFLEHPFRLNDKDFRIAVKIGVALSPDDGEDAAVLFANAESALKKAKAAGDRVLFYAQVMSETAVGRLTLDFHLRHALDNDEFLLHYQPKINATTGRMTSVEALIRWNSPTTGLVPPGRFIPVLEETGLIIEVGKWVLRTAVRDYLRWHAAGLDPVRIAVNVSPRQLRRPGFIAEVQEALAVDPRAASGLELEITESLIMEDVGHSIATLQAIRDLGVTIAIDDFGTGYSSLSYLAKLPVDTLKIDRSFITEMCAGPDGALLVSTIINLAHSLNRKVVAEGVETQEQSQLLTHYGCDEMQGFLFCRPLPTQDFEARYLRKRQQQLPAQAAAIRPS